MSRKVIPETEFNVKNLLSLALFFYLLLVMAFVPAIKKMHLFQLEHAIRD